MWGSLLSISSSDWVGVWFGLEVNLFAVVPFFCGIGSSKEMEAVIKYYIVQSIGSMVLLLGAIMGCCGFGFLLTKNEVNSLPFMMLMGGLIVKMGLVPFHFWIPGVMSGLSWISCLVLSVWQKLVPLVVLGSLMNGVMVNFVMLMAGLGGLIGGAGGFLQTQFRVLMAYSSIGHSGWLVAGSLCSPFSGVCYFLLYSLLTGVFFILLSYMNLEGYQSLGGSFSPVSIGVLLLMSSFLVGMAGMPPTIGFAMKWSVFLALLPDWCVLLSLLVVGSLLSLYYYLCMISSWCIHYFSLYWLVKWVSSSKLSWFVVGVLFTSLFGLGMFFLVTGLCY
uniref:NADH dehydrogenase subunit 2 n=1 Tax=Pillucina pisidium (Dunker, 1860) TaxID=244488 RepID=UPI00233EFBA5|nr:NADH dehydrogenase subunit 2 [Pillucina pisidium (Dunker, 1860)]WBR65417.1 NADH dehydrogenase subunit 2 [Pillucina pisidium (Dunker, 1860)]